MLAAYLRIGYSKRGIGLHVFENNSIEFRKLIDKVDKVYEEIA